MATFDLALKGGGIRGVAHIGALRKLLSAGHDVRRVIGTSAGAIFGSFFAAGYRPDEMEAAVRKGVVPDPKTGRSVFQEFLQTPDRNTPPPNAAFPDVWKRFGPQTSGPSARTITMALSAVAGISDPERRKNVEQLYEMGSIHGLALVLTGAVFAASRFEAWYAEQLACSPLLKGTKSDPARISLKRFHELMQSASGPRQLSLVAADMTNYQVLVLNHRTAPDLPVATAVRMSMSIPFVWGEVDWLPRYGAYRPGSGVRQPVKVADGGMLANFPLRFLTHPRHSAADGVLGPLPGTAEPLGLLLDGHLPVPNNPGRVPGLERREVPVPVYGELFRFANTLVDGGDLDAAADDPGRVCRIGTAGYSPLEFHLGDEDVSHLLAAGECGMTEFLQARKR